MVLRGALDKRVSDQVCQLMQTSYLASSFDQYPQYYNMKFKVVCCFMSNSALKELNRGRWQIWTTNSEAGENDGTHMNYALLSLHNEVRYLEPYDVWRSKCLTPQFSFEKCLLLSQTFGSTYWPEFTQPGSKPPCRSWLKWAVRLALIKQIVCIPTSLVIIKHGNNKCTNHKWPLSIYRTINRARPNTFSNWQACFLFNVITGCLWMPPDW